MVAVGSNTARWVRFVHKLQALVQVVLKQESLLTADFWHQYPQTCIAVSEATIAGDPKPWVIIEKWVR